MSVVAKQSPISDTAEHLLRYASGQQKRQTQIYRHAHRNTRRTPADGEVITSCQSILTTGRIAIANGQFNCIRQVALV